MAQASGSSAEIWYKIEQANGVTPSVDSGASTTLATAVNPGATSIVVASATGIAAGEILRVGNSQNMEFVKVDAGYVSGTTITLDTNTKLNYRHESGEDVKETDPTGNWFKLGNVRSFTPSGGQGAAEVAGALGLARALKLPRRELRRGGGHDGRARHRDCRALLSPRAQ